MKKCLRVGLLWIALATSLNASEWTTLTGCRYLPNEYNGGDSFHVSHQGTEYIFRLYFVDTPETEESFPERVQEQASHFGVSSSRAMEIGRYAKQVAAQALSSPFTVVTRFQDARGRSQIPRYYAVVITDTGKDLGSLMVENGLARTFGMKATLPNGTSVSRTVGQLEKLEEKARRQQLGAYGSKDSIRLSRETTEVPDEPIAPALSDPVPDSENLMAQVEIRDDLDRLNSVFAKSIARTSSKANPAAMSSPNPAKPLESSSDLIFLNTASNEDLERIPGIGPKLAAAIIEHRPLKRIEDLQSVPGIGQQKYEAAVTHLKQ